MGPLRRPAQRTVLIVLVVTAAVPPVVAGAGAETPGPPARAGTAHVVVETIAIDRRGTWSVGIDEADIRSGTEGVLEKSAALIGRQDAGPREMVQIHARMTPVLLADGTCLLRISSEVSIVVGGASGAATKGARPDRRSFSLEIHPAEERMAEIYSSAHTQARLALKVRCAEPFIEKAPDARFAGFLLSVARADGDGDLVPLKSNGLRAAVGREASNVFTFNVPLGETPDAGKRYRREHIEVRVTPVLFDGGKLQFDLKVVGELATVSALKPTVSHPIDRSERIELGSGGIHTVEIEVDASGGVEGWSKVRYRLTTQCQF